MLSTAGKSNFLRIERVFLISGQAQVQVCCITALKSLKEKTPGPLGLGP